MTQSITGRYERLARDLVEAYNTGDDNIVRQIRNYFQAPFTIDQLFETVRRRLGIVPGCLDKHTYLTLADTQLIIARQCGYGNWEKFIEHITLIAQINTDE